MKNTTSVTYESNESSYFVNNETGEIQNESHRHTTTVRHGKEPNYIKLYLDHLARFKGVQISLNPILTECLKYITYASGDESNGGMLLILNKFLKEQIAKKCGVSLQRVNNAVTEFVKKGYMRRIDLGSYQLNPFLFGKGEWKDINNIRARFDYGTGEVIAEIVKKEEEAINKATDEIANKSLEELTELQKKKRYEELDYVPLEFWSETDYAIANEKLEEFIYDYTRTSKNIAMSMLRCGKSFAETAEETGYSLKKIIEFHELMLYEAEQEKKQNDLFINSETGEMQA